ncbi:MAG: LPXTG cell wall anchor domain-containing protein, partial [Firmicutes bacterium]|nr:LPXTG cell wall anchor domain-containing protein [Bacillota bacterium]
PPINPPVDPPIDPPINPPVEPPIDPPINPPVEPPIDPPTNPPVETIGNRNATPMNPNRARELGLPMMRTDSDALRADDIGVDSFNELNAMGINMRNPQFAVSPDVIVLGEEDWNEFADAIIVNFEYAEDAEPLFAGIFEPGPRFISGYMWVDSVRSGLRTGNDKPITGRRVYLFAYNYAESYWYQATDYFGNDYVLTDENGFYSFAVNIADLYWPSQFYMSRQYYRVIFQRDDEVEFFTEPWVGATDDEVSTFYNSDAHDLDRLPMVIDGEINIDLYENMAITQILTVSAPDYSLIFDHEIADFWNENDVENINAGILVEPYSTISGMTWEDTNEDGIRNANESPIAGATVALFQYDFSRGLWSTTPSALLAGEPIRQTSGTGTYNFVVDPIVYDTNSEHYMRVNRFRVGFLLADGMYEFTSPGALNGLPLDSKAFSMEELLENERFEGFTTTDWLGENLENWAISEEITLADYAIQTHWLSFIPIIGNALQRNNGQNLTADSTTVRNADFIDAGMLTILRTIYPPEPPPEPPTEPPEPPPTPQPSPTPSPIIPPPPIIPPTFPQPPPTVEIPPGENETTGGGIITAGIPRRQPPQLAYADYTENYTIDTIWPDNDFALLLTPQEAERITIRLQQLDLDEQETIILTSVRENPQTGSNEFNFILWGAIMGVSAVLFIILLKKRKKEDNEKDKSEKTA